MLTVCQHFVFFLLSSKSHKCQKHAEQELMKMADKHRYCKNLPNISGRFRVTLDHVWPLRYITLTNPCVIYLYCFYVVSSTQNTHTSYIAISLHNINICNIYDVKYAFKHCMYTAYNYKRDMCWFVEQFGIALFSTCVYVSDTPMCNTLKDMLQFTR